MAVLVLTGSATASDIRTTTAANPKCGGHVHPERSNGPRHSWRPFQRLAKHAWRAERWHKADPRPAKQKRRMRHQRKCAVAGHRKVMKAINRRQRRQFTRHRKRRLAAKRSSASWCAPNPHPEGSGCWVIPERCVLSESGGSWGAVGDHGTSWGPYQLHRKPVPWPVTNRDEALAHHAYAAGLYRRSGLQPWFAPGCH